MKQLIILTAVLILSGKLFANTTTPPIDAEQQQEIADILTQYVKSKTHIRSVIIDSIKADKKNLELFTNLALSYMIFDKDDIKNIEQQVKEVLPPNLKKLNLKIYSDQYPITEYLSDNRNKRFENKVSKPLVSNTSKAYAAPKGLDNRHLAMWQSHGKYYNQKYGRWQWQRARVFQTVEDMYTQTYILPYLVPMLENAGANILLPRERDTQSTEVIVDKDFSSAGSLYLETDGTKQWKTGANAGFANPKAIYYDNENPFTMGLYQETTTIKSGKESTVQWIPNIPKKSKYAVYVSYHSAPNSTEEANYTVKHLGGETSFKVNQTMGGGTWIYLGTFMFDTGNHANNSVTLTNKTNKTGKLITADAVRFGGGMGNIARKPLENAVITENVKSSDTLTVVPVTATVIDFPATISNYPRFLEGARYSLQWAGVPDSVYSYTQGKNDYTDDYMSRPRWVNYIAGGSSVLPKQDGLKIPIDMSFAFHTDAGTTYNDSIIGTLGICMTHTNDELFANGKPRILSRDLTQHIMRAIETTIRTNYNPKWTTRSIWNKSYAEARVPEVPTMLLELLSHQNFEDMRYGLDPAFRFSVSRAIYVGILKYLAQQYKQDYVVQPLPVNTFSIKFEGEQQIKLQWEPTEDKLEPTAKPTAYILYTRIGDTDFDNGTLVKDTAIALNIDKDKIYSYKITAINDGGESFPSEILSACRRSNQKGLMLVINAFDRVAAPASFTTQDSIAGFASFLDGGVPYINRYNYIGEQKEFDRRLPWLDDDSSGFGDSYSTHETMLIAGNTFDYPFTHGQAIVANGYSFVSCSRDAVIKEHINLLDFKLVDLILGKQLQTLSARGYGVYSFKTFPLDLQHKITEYCKHGGHILVSGSYVASDLWTGNAVNDEDKQFAINILKYKWRTNKAAKLGGVQAIPYPITQFGATEYSYYNEPNETSYTVEAPDGIVPADDKAYTIFRYSENGIGAGVAYDGDDYKTVILGFPVEAIKKSDKQEKLMKSILDFLDKK